MIDRATKVSCKEAAQLMSARRDRDLDATKAKQLKRHLLMRLNCEKYDQRLDLLRKMADRYGHVSMSLPETGPPDQNHYWQTSIAARPESE
jgi:hypothetical protein